MHFVFQDLDVCFVVLVVVVVRVRVLNLVGVGSSGFLLVFIDLFVLAELVCFGQVLRLFVRAQNFLLENDIQNLFLGALEQFEDDLVAEQELLLVVDHDQAKGQDIDDVVVKLVDFLLDLEEHFLLHEVLLLLEHLHRASLVGVEAVELLAVRCAIVHGDAGLVVRVAALVVLRVSLLAGAEPFNVLDVNLPLAVHFVKLLQTGSQDLDQPHQIELHVYLVPDRKVQEIEPRDRHVHRVRVHALLDLGAEYDDVESPNMLSVIHDEHLEAEDVFRDEQHQQQNLLSERI